MKANHAIVPYQAPADHEQQGGGVGIKIIQWTSFRINSKSKIKLSRKEFYGWILGWKSQLGQHWKFYHLRQYLREHKDIHMEKVMNMNNTASFPSVTHRSEKGEFI